MRLVTERPSGGKTDSAVRRGSGAALPFLRPDSFGMSAPAKAAGACPTPLATPAQILTGPCLRLFSAESVSPAG